MYLPQNQVSNIRFSIDILVDWTYVILTNLKCSLKLSIRYQIVSKNSESGRKLKTMWQFFQKIGLSFIRVVKLFQKFDDSLFGLWCFKTQDKCRLDILLMEDLRPFEERDLQKFLIHTGASWDILHELSLKKYLLLGNIYICGGFNRFPDFLYRHLKLS